MIWAPTLSRASVHTAVKAHHTAATNDDTASMKRMAHDEGWMGSVLRGFGKTKITITLADKQMGDGFGVVTLYGPNRKQMDNRDCKDENPCTVNFPLEVEEKTYFVAIAHQKAGDVIVSAPIWYVP